MNCGAPASPGRFGAQQRFRRLLWRFLVLGPLLDPVLVERVGQRELELLAQAQVQRGRLDLLALAPQAVGALEQGCGIVTAGLAEAQAALELALRRLGGEVLQERV